MIVPLLCDWEYLNKLVIVGVCWFYRGIELSIAFPSWQLAQNILIPWELVFMEEASRSITV